MKEPLLYKIIRPLICLIMKFFRPRIIGKENIPKEGAIVLAGNHTSYFDCLLLISSTPRCIHFLAKDSLYKGWKKKIFKRMGIIPVNRKIHDKDALKQAKNVLLDKKVIGIFPEGTINKTKDTIMPFKIGAVKMASDTDTEIIPFTIKGKYKFLRKSVKIQFEKPYKLTCKDLDEENQKLMNKIRKKLEKSDN